jgi:hypothetical protein
MNERKNNYTKEIIGEEINFLAKSKTMSSEIEQVLATHSAPIVEPKIDESKEIQELISLYPEFLKPKRGRKPIYATEEERHAAKLRQTKESNKRIQEKRKQLEQQMQPLQHKLIKIMNNNIIDNDAMGIIECVIETFHGKL